MEHVLHTGQKAAERAGLDKRFAQALAGTLEEMAYNVFDHSCNPRSGIAGYRWAFGRFEYVVADSGVGVLSSLRSSPRYQSILDSGEALEVAVADGESRHDLGTGRGFGFHALLTNIARRTSSLRFRSGDHALIIDGTGQEISREIRQTGNLSGMVVSVLALAQSPLQDRTDLS